jgi:hypothetical protein
MGSICLVKAGSFFLGIDTSHIVSHLSVDDLKNEKIKKNTSSTLLFLESFLVQKDLEISCSKIIILKNKSAGEPLMLLIDEILGEFKLPELFAPLPLLYPELAIKCCPQIFIHGDKIVLFLDPKQLNIIHKKSQAQTNHGVITLNNLLPTEEEIETEDISQPENSDTSAIKDKSTQPETDTEIDEATITTIVSWTFDRFNKFDLNEKIIISTDELPPGIIQQNGLSNALLQQLIDKTIEKCKKTRYQTLKTMIEKQWNEINS